MRIEFESRVWDLDPTHIQFQQAMVIQSFTGMSIGEWEDSIEVTAEKDPVTGEERVINPPPEWLKSIGALYWLMHAQAGEKIPISEMDFDFGDFMLALMAGTARELERVQAEAASKPDPTSSPSSQLGDQPSPVPAYPTAMTPTPPVQPEGAPATAYTPPATWPA